MVPARRLHSWWQRIHAHVVSQRLFRLRLQTRWAPPELRVGDTGAVAGVSSRSSRRGHLGTVGESLSVESAASPDRVVRRVHRCSCTRQQLAPGVYVASPIFVWVAPFPKARGL